VRIAREALAALTAHALEGYPLEVCGALLAAPVGEEARVTRALRLQNRETGSPRLRYEVAPQELLGVFREAEQAGLEVVGYYHSHPDHPARPSETDRQRAAESISDGVIHVVVAVAGGKTATAAAWVFRDGSGAFESETLDVEG
jgi:proteasome lid subunit RPN8/RPN11